MLLQYKKKKVLGKYHLGLRTGITIMKCSYSVTRYFANRIISLVQENERSTLGVCNFSK